MKDTLIRERLAISIRDIALFNRLRTELDIDLDRAKRMICQQEVVRKQQSVLKSSPEHHCPSCHRKLQITQARETALEGKVWSRQEASGSAGHWAASLLTSPPNSNLADKKSWWFETEGGTASHHGPTATE